MVNIKIEDSKIKVKSSYDSYFVRKAKEYEGRWNAPYWVFPIENEEYVRNLCMKVYGEDGKTDTQTVKVRIEMDKYRKSTIGRFVFAERRARDSEVTFAQGVMVVKGEFEESGGSRNSPQVTWESGTEIEIKKLPLPLYKGIEGQDGVTLVKEVDSKEKLKKEKEQLLKRLAEINELLEQ